MSRWGRRCMGIRWNSEVIVEVLASKIAFVAVSLYNKDSSQIYPICDSTPLHDVHHLTSRLPFP